MDCPMRSSERTTSSFTGLCKEGQAPEINLSARKRELGISRGSTVLYAMPCQPMECEISAWNVEVDDFFDGTTMGKDQSRCGNAREPARGHPSSLTQAGLHVSQI
jgi:hypothetical protein